MSRSLPVVVESYERADLCAPCGGRCCKSMPGAAMPHDFGSTPEEIGAALAEAFATRMWTIDWWEGDPRDVIADDSEYSERSYFVRPAIAGKPGLFDPSWGGRCTFLGANGCEISESRPSGCRGLEPVSPQHCEVRHSSKQDAAIAWLPFHSVILSAAQRSR